MKKIHIVLYFLSILFLLSCQKEADFSNGNNNSGNTNGSSGSNGAGLLKKIVSKSGSDSSVLLFGFNSSQKLMTLDLKNAGGGFSTLQQERLERNSQGIIQKLIIKSDAYQQSGFDSIVTNIQYSGGRYISKVTKLDLVVLVTKDSVSLIYDGAGKIVSEKEFIDLGTGSYEEYRKIDYTYNGNNITSIKNYSYDIGTSSYSLQETYTYDQYDNKISPMSIGIEAFMIDSAPFYSTNNPTKSSISSPLTPTYNYTITYNYNSSGKPATATSIIQPGNTTINGTYYYQ